eukprot:TRINITY_DN9188_c0_g1_i10.p1 TRINITY_DN9188_c0_g1~~TRINITY_DN9188_c0_g1_i10.p1  ORF type:complete len:249 (+),score=-24.68 TRINITY_DN9188_c0_g1_i10:685-1431(+)
MQNHKCNYLNFLANKYKIWLKQHFVIITLLQTTSILLPIRLGDLFLGLCSCVQYHSQLKMVLNAVKYDLSQILGQYCNFFLINLIRNNKKYIQILQITKVCQYGSIVARTMLKMWAGVPSEPLCLHTQSQATAQREIIRSIYAYFNTKELLLHGQNNYVLYCFITSLITQLSIIYFKHNQANYYATNQIQNCLSLITQLIIIIQFYILYNCLCIMFLKGLNKYDQYNLRTLNLMQQQQKYNVYSPNKQ